MASLNDSIVLLRVLLQKHLIRNLTGSLSFHLLFLSSGKLPGFSSDELVHGRHLRSPLGLLYYGWRDLSLRKIDVCQWVDTLGARLELLRDAAALNSAEELAKLKAYYDCSATERSFSEGDKVLYQIPGRPHKLSDSWEGLYIVIERKNQVNYKIK